jgi:hypothetical protein
LTTLKRRLEPSENVRGDTDAMTPPVLKSASCGDAAARAERARVVIVVFATEPTPADMMPPVRKNENDAAARSTGGGEMEARRHSAASR